MTANKMDAEYHQKMDKMKQEMEDMDDSNKH